MAQNIFRKLKSPPDVFKPGCATDYLNHNGNIIFIEYTNDEDDLMAICEYNLDKQIITKMYEYPLNRLDDTMVMGMTIDRKNHMLYMLGDDLLLTLDLNQNCWDIISRNEQNSAEIQQGNITISNFYFIPSPVNELHLTSKYHWKLDKKQRQLIKFENDTSILNGSVDTLFQTYQDVTGLFVYRESTKQLIVLQSKCDYLAICDIIVDDKNDIHVSDWKQHEIKLHRKPYMCDMKLGWDQIIFWFEFAYYTDDGKLKTDDPKIWCLDLNYNDKWYESQVILPFAFDEEQALEDLDEPLVIMDDDDNIHFMSFNDNDRGHYRTALFNLLPKEIITINTQRWDPLIIGFIKEFEQQNDLIFIIPMHLQRLITEFYPIFV